MNKSPLLAVTLVVTASLSMPARAQDHSVHDGQPAPSAGAQSSPPVQADPHAGHSLPPVHPTQPTDHNMMDHGAIKHGSANDSASSAGVSPGPMMETPQPVAAGSGPARAADAIWGADAMFDSRKSLRESHGDFPVFWFQGDRLEAQMRGGHNGYLWDFQGYYGGPTSRLWFKSEGEGDFGKAIEDAEVQALYSRAIAPFWDLQLGVRQDVAGDETTHAVMGVQGLAPYMFEVDAAMFVSHRGDITARIEAELDQRITRKLILQPRAEVNLSAQNVPRLGIGAGIDSVEAGVRLRYEITREFAPYVGVEQSWRVGRSGDFARASGEDPSVTNYVVGIRFWF
jgi:copper resistance protein B